MDTIKEQIVQAVYNRAAEITGGAYNTTLKNVYRGINRAQTADLPAAFITPELQEVPEESGYYYNSYLLPITVQVTKSFNPETESADDIGNLIEADLIECFFGSFWTLEFRDGALNAGYSQSDLLGEVGVDLSGGEYTVYSISVSSGDFASGNAAGTITIIRPDSDVFLIGTHQIGVVGSIFSTGAVPTKKKLETEIFGSLGIIHYSYVGSGIESYPEIDDTVVSVILNLEIQYKTKPGNPYAQ